MTTSALDNNSIISTDGTTRIPYAPKKLRANLRKLLFSVLGSVGALVYVALREEQHLGHWQTWHHAASMAPRSFGFAVYVVVIAGIVGIGGSILRLARMRDIAAGGADFLSVGPTGIGSAEFPEKLRWRNIAGFSVRDKRNRQALVIHTLTAPGSVWQRMRSALQRERFKAPTNTYPIVLKADGIDYSLAALQTLLLAYLDRYGTRTDISTERSTSAEARHGTNYNEGRRG